MVKFFVFALAMISVSCADPKYIAEPAQGPSQQKAETEKLEFATAKKKLWFSWELYPGLDDPGAFILKVGRENYGDLSPFPENFEGELAIVVTMPSMGHDSPVPPIIEKVDVGTYRVSRVFFSMEGQWEIQIQRLVNGVRVDQAILPIRF